MIYQAFDDYKVFKEKMPIKVIKRTRKLTKKVTYSFFRRRNILLGLVVKDDLKSDEEYNWYMCYAL